MKGRGFGLAASMLIGLTFLVLLLSQAVMLLAQTNVGTILGVVHDPSGAIVPGATVTVKQVLTNVTRQIKTNASGSYTFPNLPIGNYDVTAAAKGFKTSVRGGINVTGSEAYTIDFQLELGPTSQTVQVSSAAAKIDTTTTTSGTTLTSSEISDLPLLVNGGGRNALSLFSTLPGVIGGPGGVVNGGPEGGVGYWIDGTMGGYAGHGISDDPFGPPPEAIAELRLNATNDSQYGANSGIVMTAITKSGTNHLHGDLFEYVRNQVFNAKCWFCSSADPSKQNEYGFTVGGPVVLPKIYNGKDRTFFFGVFDKFSFRTAAGGTVQTVPTALMRQGNFSEWLAFGPSRQIYDPDNVVFDPVSGEYVRTPFTGNIIPQDRWSKVSQYYQSFFPPANRPGLVNNWVGQSVPGTTDNTKYSIKVDHNFNQGRQRIVGFYDDTKTNQLNPGNWSGPLATGYLFQDYERQIRASWEMSVGGNMVVSFRTALNRNYAGGVTAPNAQAAEGGELAGIKSGTFSPYTPQVFAEGFGSFGIAPFAGTDANTQDILPVNVDLNWAKGHHNAKFGFSFVNNTLVNQDCFGCAGYAIFSGLTSSGLAGSVGMGYADFLLGTPFLYIVNSPLYTKYLSNEWGFYAEDSWRLTPKLTMDIGARLDIAQTPHEAHDRISFVDLNIPNPGAGGLLGARSFFGDCKGCNGMHRVTNPVHAVSPHIGFAYHIRPKTVIRASYSTSTVNLLGLFESGVQLALGGGSAGFNFTGVGYYGGVGLPSSPPKAPWDNGFPIVAPPLPDLSPTISNGTSVGWWDPHNFKVGLSQNFSLGVEQELPHSVVVKLSYVGNLSHGLPVADVLHGSDINPKYASLGNLLGQDINSPAAVAAGIKSPFPGFSGTVAQALGPYPQYLGVSNIAQSFGESLYHSFQMTVQKRFGDLSFLGSYTISKQLNNYGQFSGLGEAYTFGQTQNDAYVSKYKNLGQADIPQMLVLSWVYHLPFGPGKKFLNSGNSVLGQIVGGWKLAAIQTYQKGGIISVSQSNLGIPGFGAIWPVRVPGVPIRTSTSCGNYDPNNPQSDAYLNVAAFRDPAPFQIGNTQVLPSTRTCGYLNEDVSLQKVFKIREGIHFEIAGDAQNLFNRHSWVGLNTNIDTVGTFGQYTGTTGPRLMQIHARLVF